MEVNIGKKDKGRLGGGYNPLDPTIQALAAEAEREDKFFSRAIAVAVIAHLVALFVVIPSWKEEVLQVSGGNQKVFVMQQLRFEPPPPAKAEEKKEKQAKKIPIPDPTPDDPEPLIEEEPELVPETFEVDASDAFGIPDGPPANGIGGPVNGAIAVSGNVVAPEKIYAPKPPYTEDARKARIEGVVILETVVDVEGAVRNVKVLKGLPNGLTEQAVATVQQWKFKPATLEGNPVAVYFMLSVSFRIQ